MEHCDACGFDFDSNDARMTGPAIIEAVATLSPLLDDEAADLASRSASQTWSPLEYGCHLRDVLTVQRERVLLARRVDRASPPMMGRDERVDHDGYAEQNPKDVAVQLTETARLFANVLARLGPTDWERTVVYDGLEPPERSLAWVALDTWHEVRHHLLDVQRLLGTT